MSLITYPGLVVLASTGVIEAAKPEHINAASIDIRLGTRILVEASPNGLSSVVDLAGKEVPAMREIDLAVNGYYDLRPGDFCLAGTIERFNLPNDIAAEYRLNSSLARAGLDAALAMWCFTGDTKIPLLNGDHVPIANLVGTTPWVYSMDPTGRVVPAKAENIHKVREVAETVTVGLDSGESFTCTPDHLIMLRDGTYKAAELLSPGMDTVMPFHTRDVYGREQVYCPNLRKGKKSLGSWVATHRLVAGAIHGDLSGFAVHHIDHDVHNNNPDNLMLLCPKEHFSYHNSVRAKQEKPRERSRKWMRDLMGELWKDPEYRARQTVKNRKLAMEVNSKRWSDPSNREKASEWNRGSQAYESLHLWHRENPEESRRRVCLGVLAKVVHALVEDNLAVTPETYTQRKRQQAHSVRRIEELFGSFDSALREIGYSNHLVKSISRTRHSAPVPVYDMTIPEYHNFAISAGVFVHNCDPGWHGSVLTLELSNSLRYHSLRLRPGMRIGQMIFLRGEPVPESASYASRGKYNGDSQAQQSKGLG